MVSQGCRVTSDLTALPYRAHAVQTMSVLRVTNDWLLFHKIFLSVPYEEPLSLELYSLKIIVIHLQVQCHILLLFLRLNYGVSQELELSCKVLLYLWCH